MKKKEINKVILFGGTGFIGLNLAQYLKDRGIEPILIGRNQPDGVSFKFVFWDAIHLGPWVEELSGTQALVNLCGKSVDCIKTPSNCDLILRSRVQSTELIGSALRKVKDPPKIWVQMSTAHIYGDPPAVVCTENSSLGYGLAPFVGRAWEEALQKSLVEGMREVRLRTSFVIGKDGGAFPRLKSIAKWGLGGKIGDGSQGLSWIHEEDLNEIIYQSITNTNYQGVVIASAPHPLSQGEFMRVLRKKMKMPFGLPATALMARLGARCLFNTDPNLLLYGRYVKSERLAKLNFEFKFPELADAISEVLK